MTKRSLLAVKHALADDAVRIAQGMRDRSTVRRDKFIAVAALTAREEQILRLVGLGLDDQEIADIIGISKWTVHVHMRRIHDKTAISSRWRLAVAAYVATEGAGA